MEQEKQKDIVPKLTTLIEIVQGVRLSERVLESLEGQKQFVGIFYRYYNNGDMIIKENIFLNLSGYRGSSFYNLDGTLIGARPNGK